MPYAPWDPSSYYSRSPIFGGYSGGGYAGSGGGAYNSGAPVTVPYTSSLQNYNINPGYQGGQGAYGQVPGPIGIPPSTYDQAVKSLPGLGTAGTAATNAVLKELQGDISPQALRNIQDAAAQFGVSSGMPGSNAMLGTLAANKALLGNYRTTEQLQQQGLQNYASLLGAVGQQQISPALAAEIAAHNAQLGAAPNPKAAAEQQLANYFASLAATRGLGLRGAGAGGGYGFNPAGGTGVYAQQPAALGFGFGSFGGGQPVDTRFSNTGVISNYPSPSNPITDLDFGFGSAPTYQSYNPITDLDFGFGNTGSYYPDASNYDYWDMAQNDFGLQPQGYNDWSSYYNDLGGFE